jgi:hypothetical protein
MGPGTIIPCTYTLFSYFTLVALRTSPGRKDGRQLKKKQTPWSLLVLITQLFQKEANRLKDRIFYILKKLKDRILSIL